MASSSTSQPPPEDDDEYPRISFRSTERDIAVGMMIMNRFKEIIEDPLGLDDATNYLYESLIDDAVLGVFIEIHQLYKTGNLIAIEGVEEEEDESYRIVNMPNFDIFGMSTAKRPMDITCPHCERMVSAARFAPHLEKCMGMGRNSSRIASRRLATSKDGASTSGTYFQVIAATDDEEDSDWSEKRRKKNSQNNRNNGNKKNNGKSA